MWLMHNTSFCLVFQVNVIFLLKINSCNRCLRSLVTRFYFWLQIRPSYSIFLERVIIVIIHDQRWLLSLSPIGCEQNDYHEHEYEQEYEHEHYLYQFGAQRNLVQKRNFVTSLLDHFKFSLPCHWPKNLDVFWKWILLIKDYLRIEHVCAGEEQYELVGWFLSRDLQVKNYWTKCAVVHMIIIFVIFLILARYIDNLCFSHKFISFVALNLWRFASKCVTISSIFVNDYTEHAPLFSCI